jgi:hypothetical protein
VVVLLGLALGICAPYFALQHVSVFPLRTVPITRVDEVVPFEPVWVYAYLSVAFLVPLFPLLAAHRDDLLRFSRGLSLLCVSCFAFFLLSRCPQQVQDASPRSPTVSKPTSALTARRGHRIDRPHG